VKRNLTSYALLIVEPRAQVPLKTRLSGFFRYPRTFVGGEMLELIQVSERVLCVRLTSILQRRFNVSVDVSTTLLDALERAFVVRRVAIDKVCVYVCDCVHDVCACVVTERAVEVAVPFHQRREDKESATLRRRRGECAVLMSARALTQHNSRQVAEVERRAVV
jgi:hypothetical protein